MLDIIEVFVKLTIFLICLLLMVAPIYIAYHFIVKYW
jgi:hypothetical protein